MGWWQRMWMHARTHRELSHEVLRQFHVLEHTLQLGGEGGTALRPQPTQHACEQRVAGKQGADGNVQRNIMDRPAAGETWVALGAVSDTSHPSFTLLYTHAIMHKHTHNCSCYAPLVTHTYKNTPNNSRHTDSPTQQCNAPLSIARDALLFSSSRLARSRL